MNDLASIAYFSMEVALEEGMPTYSGGLGVLAGDTIRAAADLRVPMLAMTLLHRKGYFYQRLDPNGSQIGEPVAWVVEDFVREMTPRVSVAIEGRTVELRCWRYETRGAGGHIVLVYFLDADLPENSDWDRTLTDYLYGGDQRYRLCQEVVLGIGGVRMLRALGHQNVRRFHMNESHSSLLTLELLIEETEKAGKRSITIDDIVAVKKRCIFTTHTPVPAGHEKFPIALVRSVLGHEELLAEMKNLICCGDIFHLTFLGLNLSDYVNGVAKKHGEISRLMFSGYNIDAITNGVHAATWASGSFQELYDRYVSGWKQDNFSLRYALSIPKQEIWDAHMQAKRQFIRYVNRQTNAGMDFDVLTLGFARRAATYKRGDLLFQDTLRLKRIASKAGPFQVVYAGKAHPRDEDGKELIRRIFQSKEALKPDIKVAYLENYDLEIGKMITSGVDVWLNTPQPPLEASGTSGMKAALNGVPSLSILDGWWIEGCIEGVTGWAIGENGTGEAPRSDRSEDARWLYDKLENVVIPFFYRDRERFIDVMVHCIALNGSFFNTHRMIQQYVLKAYL
ncbi:MAG: alpha-glucan family phosphorylase [Deltaproteobacteria bacterium]|nr:alpha-glucan family phosphorylase [Deltaproteobacteria bacterium]